MTAGLSMFSRDSVAQILIGILVAFAHHTHMSKKEPFLEDSDDFLSQISGIQIFLTLLIGLILKLEVKSDRQFVEASLIGMTLLILIFGIISIVATFDRKKRLDKCLATLYGHASRHLGGNSKPKTDFNSDEMQTFENPVFRTDIAKTPLVRKIKKKRTKRAKIPPKRAKAPRRPAEVIGISLTEFSKRKKHASRHRKQGRGLSWLKKVDEETGDIYYVNEASGKTAWTVPAGAVVVSLGPDAKASIEIQDEWEELVDTENGTGEVYFHNTRTGQISWEKPKWLKYKDAKTGDFYYSNELSGEVVWTAPRGAEIVSMVDGEDSTRVQKIGEWQEFLENDTGKIYYYNSRTAEKTWIKPDAMVEVRLSTMV